MRTVVAISLSVWFLFFAAFVGLTTFDYFGGNLSCGELVPGDSYYGTSHWNWVDLGTSCSWALPADSDDDPAGVHTDSDDGGGPFYLLALIAWPVTTLAVARAGSRRRDVAST